MHFQNSGQKNKGKVVTPVFKQKVESWKEKSLVQLMEAYWNLFTKNQSFYSETNICSSHTGRINDQWNAFDRIAASASQKTQHTTTQFLMFSLLAKILRKNVRKFTHLVEECCSWPRTYNERVVWLDVFDCCGYGLTSWNRGEKSASPSTSKWYRGRYSWKKKKKHARNLEKRRK